MVWSVALATDVLWCAAPCFRAPFLLSLRLGLGFSPGEIGSQSSLPLPFAVVGMLLLLVSALALVSGISGVKVAFSASASSFAAKASSISLASAAVSWFLSARIRCAHIVRAS